MSVSTVAIALTLSGGVTAIAAQAAPAQPGPAARYAIVPWPASLQPSSGQFLLTAGTVVAFPETLTTVAAFAQEMLRAALGVSLGSAGPAAPGPVIALRLDATASAHAEGYRLTVDTARIEIAAPAPAGVFYGLQTLRQLLPASPSRGGWPVPAVRIDDAPRFGYRGLHLDVGRHMFPVAFIKRYIDLMAMYKMNVFHWHLTEDQGWRIQILRYPRLTEIGACRRETIIAKNFDPLIGDGTPYCGYYTQDEIHAVVAHAARRHVTIIPEIEMPGHSLAALAAYPHLACTDGSFEVGTRWGVYDDIYCPHEDTFTFLEHVLTEVMDLFPGEYIHIGGDEAPKVRWETSLVAQDVIARHGLADEHELQTWFIQRIERFLAAHGRRLIGWDEILEGGLPANATVMSWRGMAGGIEAARQGHDVVMTPGTHLYFDHYQGPRESEPLAIGGHAPLRHVYAFEPVPDSLTAEQARHVLGAQANVWTEYIRTTDHVEYMVYPRLLALSEVVWSPKAARDWAGFRARLPRHLRLLDAHGVNYRRPDLDRPNRGR